MYILLCPNGEGSTQATFICFRQLVSLIFGKLISFFTASRLSVQQAWRGVVGENAHYLFHTISGLFTFFCLLDIALSFLYYKITCLIIKIKNISAHKRIYGIIYMFTCSNSQIMSTVRMVMKHMYENKELFF